MRKPGSFIQEQGRKDLSNRLTIGIQEEGQRGTLCCCLGENLTVWISHFEDVHFNQPDLIALMERTGFIAREDWMWTFNKPLGQTV